MEPFLSTIVPKTLVGLESGRMLLPEGRLPLTLLLMLHETDSGSQRTLGRPDGVYHENACPVGLDRGSVPGRGRHRPAGVAEAAGRGNEGKGHPQGAWFAGVETIADHSWR